MENTAASFGDLFLIGIGHRYSIYMTNGAISAIIGRSKILTIICEEARSKVAGKRCFK